MSKQSQQNIKGHLIVPKVSVITVCYNSASTIERSILSVKRQTYENIEHIVVDGLSEDQTFEIVKNLGVDKVISEKDSGIYDAMNKGILLASGEIVGFLNADDFYKRSDIIEKIVNKMVSDRLDMLYGDVDFFSPKDVNKFVRRYSSKNFSPKKLAYGFMPAHPALFMRREIYQEVGAFDINFRIAGDFDFIARAFKNNMLRSRYIPEVFVSMQTGGISTRGLKSTILLNREIMKSCAKNHINTSWVKLISRYFIKSLEFLRR